jgi:hypothetical protein
MKSRFFKKAPHPTLDSKKEVVIDKVDHIYVHLPLVICPQAVFAIFLQQHLGRYVWCLNLCYFSFLLLYFNFFNTNFGFTFLFFEEDEDLLSSHCLSKQHQKTWRQHAASNNKSTNKDTTNPPPFLPSPHPLFQINTTQAPAANRCENVQVKSRRRANTKWNQP